MICDLHVGGNGEFDFYGDGQVCAVCACFQIVKSNSHDPSLVLYNAETRRNIVELAKGTIPPDVADGAALFYNKDTKAFEVYKMAEGKFCSMFGDLLETLPKPEVAAGDEVEEVFRLDSQTGTIVKHQRLRPLKRRLKRGYQFDTATGKTYRKDDGAEVDLDEATEVTRPRATKSFAEKIAERQERKG